MTNPSNPFGSFSISVGQGIPVSFRDWGSVLLKPTSYGPPSQEAIDKFNREVVGIPDNHLNALLRYGTNFFVLGRNQSPIQAGVYIKEVDPDSFSGLDSVAAAMWEGINRQQQALSSDFREKVEARRFITERSRYLLLDRTITKDVSLGEFAEQTSGFPEGTPGHTRFLQQMRRYNHVVQEFGAVNEANLLEISKIRLMPGRTYLIPNYAGLQRTITSGAAVKHDLIHVPQFTFELEERWRATSFDGVPLNIAVHNVFYNVILLREETYPIEQDPRNSPLAHEIGHALHLTVLRQINPAAENILMDNCISALERAVRGAGLAPFMNTFTHLLSRPEELAAITYERTHAKLPGDLARIEALDPQWWQAYQSFLAEIEKAA